MRSIPLMSALHSAPIPLSGSTCTVTGAFINKIHMSHFTCLDCYYCPSNAAALRGGGAQPAPSHISAPDLTLDLVGNVG